MSKQAVAGNFLVTGAGRGLGIFIGIVTLGVLTRYLGEVRYGSYMLAFVFLTTVITISNFGFSTAQLHMMARADHPEERVVGGILGLRIGVGALCLMLSPLLLPLFDYDEAVHRLVQLGLLPFFFTYLSGALGPVFQKHLIMTRAAVAALINRLVFLALILACRAADLGVEWVMGALAVSSASSLAAQLWFLRGVVRIRPRWEPAIWQQAWGTGWPVAILTGLGLLCTQGDLLLVGSYHGQAVAGIYGLPFRILLLIISVVPTLFMGLMLPQLTRTWHQGDRAGFHSYLQVAFDFLVLALLPVLVATLMRAESIVTALADARFEPAADVLRVHVFALAAMFFGLLYRHAGIAIEHQRHLLLPSAMVTAATLGFYFWAIPAHGMAGAAWGRALHATLGSTATFALVYPMVRHLPHLRIAGRAAVAAAAMAGTLQLLPAVHAIVDIAAGCAVYAGVLLATGAVRFSQLRDSLATLGSNSSRNR